MLILPGLNSKLAIFKLGIISFQQKNAKFILRGAAEAVSFERVLLPHDVCVTTATLQ